MLHRSNPRGPTLFSGVYEGQDSGVVVHQSNRNDASG